MKIDLFENKYRPSKITKILVMDIICFVLAISMAFGVCYAYFSDSVDPRKGKVNLASLDIEYRRVAGDDGTATNIVYGSINGGAVSNITAGTRITPGDTLSVKGYAVNISNSDIYAMARLEIVTNLDSEVIWTNINGDNKLFMQNGMFNGIAQPIEAGSNLPLDIDYTFDGDKYTNQHIIQKINLTLHAHQKDYLSNADDYQDYAPFDINAENMRGEVNEAVYATHQIIGRKRSLWKSSDANVDGLTLNSLAKDSVGNYLINSCKDWMIFAKNCNASNDYCNGMNFKLNAYLDFNYMNNEISAQTLNKTIDTFKGNLDGDGYTISRWGDTNGLIYNCYGNISNLGMETFIILNGGSFEGENLPSTQYVGSMVAVMHNGAIENCFASDQYSMDDELGIGLSFTSDYSGEGHAMGTLVGLMRADSGKTATMRNCFAKSCLAYYGSADGSYIGGLVGKTDGAVSINNSYFFGGLVKGEGDYKIGSIANADANASINNSWALSVGGTAHLTHESLVSGTECEVNNCLVSDGDYFIKVGDNQTSVTITNVEQLFDVGFMNNAFGWEFDDWCGLEESEMPPTLRVFYNF